MNRSDRERAREIERGGKLEEREVEVENKVIFSLSLFFCPLIRSRSHYFRRCAVH